MKTINNKHIGVKLIKDGYYLKSCVYDNTTIYQITKDLHPINCSAYRIVYGEVNKITAKALEKQIGFKIKNKTEYVGKTETIGNYMIRQ